MIWPDAESRGATFSFLRSPTARRARVTRPRRAGRSASPRRAVMRRRTRPRTTASRARLESKPTHRRRSYRAYRRARRRRARSRRVGRCRYARLSARLVARAAARRPHRRRAPRRTPTRRVLRRALARDTMRAEHVSRARARYAAVAPRAPRAPDADDRRFAARIFGIFFNRRTPATAAAGRLARRSGSDRDPSNVQYRRRFVPRARPRPSRRPPRARSRARGRALMLRLRRIRCVTIVFCFPRRAFPAGQWRERIATTEERTRGVSSLDTGCYDSKRSHIHPNPPRTGTAGSRVALAPSSRASRRQQVASPSGRVTPRAEKLHRFRSNWTADALAFRAVFAIDRG